MLNIGLDDFEESGSSDYSDKNGVPVFQISDGIIHAWLTLPELEKHCRLKKRMLAQNGNGEPEIRRPAEQIAVGLETDRIADDDEDLQLDVQAS